MRTKTFHLLKGFLSLKFTALVVVLLMFNCQNDDEFKTTENNSKQERNLRIRPIFKEDKVNNPSVFQKLEKPRGKLNIQSNGKVIYDSINNFSINTDIGVYIEDGDYHSYTFRLDRPNGSDYLLENVVVSKNMNTLEYDVILFQYDITEDEYELINDNQYVNYEDKVTMSLLEDTNIVTEVFGKVYFADNCYDQELVFTAGSLCPSDLHHSWDYVLANAGTTNQCDYYGTTSTPTPGSWSWQSVEVACPAGGGGQDPTNPEPPDGGGSSGGNLIFTNTVGLQPWEKVERCINFLDETGTDTVYIPQNLIADLQEPQNAGLAKQCSDYLEANACDVNAQAFVVLAIYMASGDLDFDDIIYVLENEQDYREEMSEDELNLFDTLSNEEQVLYLVSAKQAIDVTNELFSTLCERYNGKGDAFRHAYWNALSSQRIGVGLTNLLTTRHENRPPRYAYESKEIEMDLFNNQVGRDIVSNGMTNLLLMQQAIQNAFDNGNLRYLNNQASNCLATLSSQLTPTNQ